MTAPADLYVREAVVLVDEAGWIHVPPQSPGRSADHIPDEDAHWDAIWSLRDRVAGTAHIHPPGYPSPSETDLETWSAIALVLGRRLRWWIVSGDEVTVSWWIGPGRHDYRTDAWTGAAPSFAAVLRVLSLEE